MLSRVQEVLLSPSPHEFVVMKLQYFEIKIDGEKAKRSEWSHVNVKVEPR